MSKSPIVHKYREGKMKRTLERELKGTEIAKRKVEKLGCNFKFVSCLSSFSFDRHSKAIACCVPHFESCILRVLLHFGITTAIDKGFHANSSTPDFSVPS